jgi:L-histidine Nalpha-methyltransferase
MREQRALKADAPRIGVDGENVQSTARFARDLRYSLALQPRQIPSRYFYDALGSALFDAISRLPWYPVTRAELGLVSSHAEEILSRLQRLSTIVELGCGNGEKLTALVRAVPSGTDRLDVHLVDVSASALASSARALASYSPASVVGHEASYESGITEAFAESRSGRALTLFLGSNIGNFSRPDAEALLRVVHGTMDRGDGFLIGMDLVKDEERLLAAYDDPLGVTAAFNRNVLVRINRELGGNFVLEAFAHRALWNREFSRVEMHLVSRSRQRVAIPSAELEFTIDEGETIWTESSYKYRASEIVSLLGQTGFEVKGQWIDSEALFALTLALA